MDVKQKLNTLNQGATAPWVIVDGKLTKHFVFKDFVHTFGFLSKVALLSEKMSHHPDCTLSYNRLGIALITHDAGCISDKDFELAAQIEGLL